MNNRTVARLLSLFNVITKGGITPKGGGGGGILDFNRRIFLGLKFSIPGFFWVRKFGNYFFGYLDLSRDFLGVLKRIGSACLRSSANKVQTNVFCCSLIVDYGVALNHTCYSLYCPVVPGRVRDFNRFNSTVKPSKFS